MSTDFDLANFLPYQLSIASNAVSNRIAELYFREFGLKVTEWRSMAMLGDAGPLTQREIAQRTLMDKVAVNRACKVLEERGLARRLPHERDGRSHHLELSEAGQDMHARIVPMARGIEEALLAEMAPGEEKTLRHLLDHIRQRATQVGPEA
ncbi:MarR family winged helix-turn-helix transcriptional regulator [Qipengyuania sp. JC766]|uniref:MarR family winged helix-turn-helix transcriptional regulator n=1 Tax=Qipengyuania sp. JC766 TaxID=3232139 RepID=UPI0034574827